jgi:hypothetical protein
MIVYTDKHHVPFIIDDEDWEVVSHFSWYIANGYPKTTTSRLNGGQHQLHLHNLLLGPAPDGLEWDHENRDKLDNRRSNLRLVTPEINVQNRGLRKTNTSGVTGVKPRGKKWNAYITSYGVRIFVTCNTREEAIQARLDLEKKSRPQLNKEFS